MTRARRVGAGAHASHTAKRMPPRRLRGSRRGLLTVTVLALSLLGSTGAWAYFTGTGSGIGTAGTGTTKGLTLQIPASVSASLYPGARADVTLTVSNPNPSPIHISTFVLDTTSGTSGFTIDTDHSACLVSSLTFTAPTGNWTVLAKTNGTAGSLPVTLSTPIAMATSAANACQGAKITVYLKADYLAAS